MNYQEISYFELLEDEQNYIDENTNETLPQGTTWFVDIETKRIYQVENNLLELHKRQSPKDLLVVWH